MTESRKQQIEQQAKERYPFRGVFSRITECQQEAYIAALTEAEERRELVEEALRVLKLRRPTTPGLGASINLLELFLNK